MNANLLFCLSVGLGIVLVPLNGPAATIVYENDFTSTGFDNQDAAYVLNTGAGTLSLQGAIGSVSNRNASNQFSNAANTSFTLETQFQVTAALSTGVGTFNNGLGAFGTDTNFASGLLADWSAFTTGTLRLYNFQDATTLASTTVDDNPGSAGLSVILNKVYILRLDVTNTTANTYNLSLGVFESNGTTQIGSSAVYSGYTAVSAPVDGYYMGLRNRLGGTENQVAFEQFAAVPEPGTAGLLLTTGVFGLALRRLARKPLK